MDVASVHRAWHDREGEYSPDYYAYYGPNESSEAIVDVIETDAPADPAILELGCSSGRHLAALYREGYRDLSGIDINPDALSVMAETYPDLADTGTFYLDAIENVLEDFDDRAFDVVFSVETLQHIHHDHVWVFEEVARVTGDLLVTVEIETPRGEGERDADTDSMTYVNDELPLYYRDWGEVFAGLGFEETGSRRLGRDTMRVFRRRE